MSSKDQGVATQCAGQPEFESDKEAFASVGDVVYAVLGGNGEWALWEILPSIVEIFIRITACNLPNQIRVVCVARSEIKKDQFTDAVRKGVVQRFALDGRHLDAEKLEWFVQNSVSYAAFDITRAESWATADPEKGDLLGRLSAEAQAMIRHTSDSRDGRPRKKPALTIIHSLAPAYMEPAVRAVGEAGFTRDAGAWGFDRVVAIFEKPFGVDYASAVKLRDAAYEVYGPENCVSADHYWTKYSIKNLICMILYNQLLYLAWMFTDPAKKQGVKSIVFSAEEDAVLDSHRLPTYVWSMALRDMFQHLVTVLAKLSLPVEVLSSMTEDADNGNEQRYLEEYMRVLKSVVIDAEEYGQYDSGMIDDKSVAAFAGLTYKGKGGQETPVPNGPTWFCIRFHFTYGSMAGVPMVLLHGKGLEKKDSKIEITFFRTPAAKQDQPEERLTVQLYEQTYRADGKKDRAKKGQVKHHMNVREGALNREVASAEMMLNRGTACNFPYTGLLARRLFYNFPSLEACCVCRRLEDEMVARYQAKSGAIKLYPAGSLGPESRILRRVIDDHAKGTHHFEVM